MTSAGDDIRGGRLSRGRRIAGLAARQGAGRLVGKLTRDEQRKLDRFTREAERYVAVLGDMKGVAMKIGQMVSFIDAGGIPEQYRTAYQQIVGTLQANAPAMPFDTVRVVLEHELGRSLGDAFAWIDEQPIAAASIGQVHGARLHDGTEVVVKVQYPGVGDAIRADLQNAEMIGALGSIGAKLSPIRVTADPKVIAHEITERISEELDYRIEAANQTRFHEHYAGHPHFRIPAVISDLSTERVLVMERHHGMRWTEALEQSPDLRNTWGEVINRFVFGSLYDFGEFNADPHPGNYLFHDDGTVTFLDFGCVKRYRPDQVDSMHRMSGAVLDDDADATLLAFQDLGCIPRRTKLPPQRVLDYWSPIWDPGRGTESFTFTPELVASIIDHNFDPFGDYGDVVRGMGISREAKDFLFLVRIQIGLYSVLGALGATGKWRSMQREMLGSCEPETTIGRHHRDWRSGRP